MSCHRCGKDIDAFVLGELSPERWARAARHLATCAPCRRRYNRAVFALRALSGKAAQVSPDELALRERAVVKSTKAPRPLLSTLALTGAAATLILGVFFVTKVLPANPMRPAGEVSARGETPAIDLEIRAYCVRLDEQGQLTVRGKSSADGHLRCGRSELLQFAYALRGDRPAYLFLVGEQSEGELLQYHPRAPEVRSIAVAPAPGEEPLKGTTRLGVRHQPGTVNVSAFVSEAPLSLEDVKFWISKGDAGGSKEPRRIRLSIEIEP